MEFSRMGKNLLFQKPVVSEFGLFYITSRLSCQKFGLSFETTGFETTGFPRINNNNNNNSSSNYEYHH